MLYRNAAGSFGGAIYTYNSAAMFSGIAYFERNTDSFGGAMYLRRNSKLILKPKLNMHFTLNHANDSGGALYFPDSRCSFGSLEPIECFIIIYIIRTKGI